VLRVPHLECGDVSPLSQARRVALDKAPSCRRTPRGQAVGLVDWVLRVCVGSTFADAQQRVPTIDVFYGFREGLRVRGIPLCGFNSRNPALERVSEHSREHPAECWPLTPMKASQAFILSRVGARATELR